MLARGTCRRVRDDRRITFITRIASNKLRRIGDDGEIRCNCLGQHESLVIVCCAHPPGAGFKNRCFINYWTSNCKIPRSVYSSSPDRCCTDFDGALGKIALAAMGNENTERHKARRRRQRERKARELSVSTRTNNLFEWPQIRPQAQQTQQAPGVPNPVLTPSVTISGGITKPPPRTPRAKPAWRRCLESKPQWYFRTMNINVVKGREYCREDFDEDISDLDEDSREKILRQRACINGDCDCDSDGHQHLEDSDIDSDMSSEGNYPGSEFDCFREIYEDREDRKRELFDMKLAKAEKVKRRRNRVLEKVHAVNSTLLSLQAEWMAARIPDHKAPLLHGRFNLFSSRYFDRMTKDHPSSQTNGYVEFLDNDSLDLQENPGHECKPGQVAAVLHIPPYTYETVKPFYPPPTPCPQPVWLKTEYYNFAISFYGSGHIKLFIDEEPLFKDSGEMPLWPRDDNTTVVFAGVFESDKERHDSNGATHRANPPSPRDTYFNRQYHG